jgi:Na+-translocating ferredoxin:NAD+ oxidoreductase RnfD subunit
MDAMAAHAAPAPSSGLSLTVRGRTYPVLLPKVSDPRLHLAAVITTLQVLGQTAFDFRLSIAQILMSLGTCALLEIGITFRKQHVLMWPASALLTGNGVAFILRVPGTEHGDWWSTRGWWIYVGTAAISLLSKYVIVWRGGHIFNPSNIGLVVCFLALGRTRAEPLDFWWGPMSPWMALAFAVIVAGGLLILSRLRLLRIAATFWLSFGAGIAVLAVSGHAVTARWHLGPIAGFAFWRVLLTSPEVLVFLFFMLTDPKTSPREPRARSAYAASVGLLAALLMAPLRTEYATKVALLGALAIVCAVRPLLALLPPNLLRRAGARRVVAVAALGLAAYAVALVTAGIPAHRASALPARKVAGPLPAITILPSRGIESQLDLPTARAIAHDLLAALAAPLRGDGGVRLWLARGEGQDPPIAVAQLASRRYTLTQSGSRWSIRGPRTAVAATPVTRTAFAGFRLTDVADRVGLDFRQGDFRFGVTNDVHSMMGGGLCWLDYNRDGWLDLFVVNSYSYADVAAWTARGGLPRSALFENVHGRFVNVSKSTHADIAIQGNGCVAADLNGDGATDLLVTSTTYNVLLWNNDDGTFTNGTHAAGIDAFGTFGWHAGAAVADVNGDGRLDVFVSGYADVNAPSTSSGGFPLNYKAFPDLLYVNEGFDARGHARFREVAQQADIERAHVDHSLGAVFTDANGDGRPDLYVTNDLDPNRLYVNMSGGPLGFHFVDQGRSWGVDDPNAGMGVAAQDYSSDGRPDLFVTNSRGQGHAAFRSRATDGFSNAQRTFARALGANATGWGASWIDFANSGRLDLIVANGAIPVTSLKKDAGRIQVLRNLGGSFADASNAAGLRPGPLVNGRGLAAADYDNDGRVDVAVNSIGGRLILLRNSGEAGHWLEVALARFAPGALVTAVLPDGSRLVREVQAGSSYLSSEDPRVHFGLGEATEVKELIVRWPGGKVTRARDVAAGGGLIVVN